MKALILAAGVSRRLYPQTYNTPKCLLEVGGKPIINYQLEALSELGINDITIIVGYHREMLVESVEKNFTEKNSTKKNLNNPFQRGRTGAIYRFVNST